MEDPEKDQGNIGDNFEGRVRDELKTDKTGFMKVGDIVLVVMKRNSYCGILSADGVISQSLSVIPRESDKEKGANVLTRSCLFRIESAMKITLANKQKSESELKQSIGKALTYGERIQLRHLHSMSFVSVNTQVMAAEPGCLQVQMSEESNEKCWFELVTTNKLRKEGEVIRYSDSICLVLVNKKSQYYLHVDETSPLSSFSRAEVNASGSFSPWMIRRFINYDLYDDNSKLVRTGDSFRIFHKISKGYLTTKQNLNGAAPEVFVQLGNLTSNSLWEIQRTVTFVGGTAVWSEEYRIKHVATGYFLQESPNGIVLTLKGFDDGTLFQFVPDQVHAMENIQYGVIVALKTSKSRYLSIDIADFEKTQINKKRLKSNKYKINLELDIDNFTGVAFMFEDVAEVNTAHVYKLSLVNPYLTDFYSYIEETNFDDDYLEENPDRFKKIKEKCEEFMKLLDNITNHIIFKVDAEVDLTSRQDAIREIGIIDVLLSLTGLLYKKILEQGKEAEVLADVYEKVYELIYNSIKSNKKNCKGLVTQEKLLISQLEIGLNRGVGRILKEIFKYATLISSITEENFSQWFSYLHIITHDNKMEQCLYLSILKFLCECNEVGVLKYQSLALKRLSNPIDDFTIIKFHILNKRPVIEFDFPQNGCNLKKLMDYNPELKEIGLVVDEQNLLIEQEPANAMFYIEDLSRNSEYSNYVACAIDFLANVCLSRYSKALQMIPLITGISLPHIALVLRNVNISEKLRAAYANMCRVMFIDIDPFIPCSIHRERCYQWVNLEKFNDDSIVQRKEVLFPIRDIIKFFWGSDGSLKVLSGKPGKSIILAVAIIKLTRSLIDLEFEDDEFIEYVMKALCLLMMKDAGDPGHWCTAFIRDIHNILDSGYYPSLEKKLSLLHMEILRILEVIVERRQNFHVIEMLRFFKEGNYLTLEKEALTEKFQGILQKLDWDISSKYTENQTDNLGNIIAVEKEKIYNMDLYILELLFEISGKRDKELHVSAINVLLQDINIRKLLAEELKSCLFLYSSEDSDTYTSILLLFKRLYTNVSLMIQEQIESSDSIQVIEAIKASTSVIFECINLYKNTQNKTLFQNLMYQSGIHRLLINILNLKLSKNISGLFNIMITAMHIFCKNNKRNQNALKRCVNRIIELLPELDLTELLCEILADLRVEKQGIRAIEAVMEQIDQNECSIEHLRFLRGTLKDFDKNWVKSNQVFVMKTIFNSQGVKRIMGEDGQDVFSPQFFLDPNEINTKAFALHLELIKTIIACSEKNSFGIMQCRKLITLPSLILCLSKPGLSYIGKEVYLKYIELVYFSNIEGELESDSNINILEPILRDVIIPDFNQVKSSYSNLIEVTKKGWFNLILKTGLRKKSVRLSANETQVVEFWKYLSHKATWSDEQSGVLHILADIFNNSTMTVQGAMEDAVRDLKMSLYEMSDILQYAETMNKDINFSRYILAANVLREALPRTAIYSGRGPNNPPNNRVIAGMQQYIVDHKLSLEDAFANFDIDSNGDLAFEEFRVTIRKLLGNVSSAECEMAFNEMDEDKSGTLKFSEFTNRIRKYFSKTPRIVKVKKDEEQILHTDVSESEFLINIEEKTKSDLMVFIRKFSECCEEEDMKMLVAKLKEKYIDPALDSVDAKLSESISKLGQVFYKKKHKIYLIKMLKMLVPDFQPKLVLFDEGDQEEINKKNKFMHFQATLSAAGVLDLAVSLINSESSEKLVKEATKLLISLLQFGNIKNQSKLLFLLRLHHNSHLFSYIRTQLRKTRELIMITINERFLVDPDGTVEKALITSGAPLIVEPDEHKITKSYLIEYLLYLLQLCCENCYLPFQNFLRSQEKPNALTTQASINIIDEIASFLVNIKQIGGNMLLHTEFADLIIQCLETLIDFCRGPCVENQILLGTNKKLLKFVSSIFNLFSVNRDCKSVFKSAVRFIEALLEGNFPQEIAKIMIEYLDFELLANLALVLFEDIILRKKDAILSEAIIGTNKTNQLMMFIRSIFTKFRQPLEELNLDEWELICVGFQITIITVKLRQKFRDVSELNWLCFIDEQPGYQGESSLDSILYGIDKLGGYNESIFYDIKKLLKILLRYGDDDSKMNEAYEFYTSLISSVEIEKDGKIEKCYFQMPTCMVYLSERMRHEIVYGINRNSDEEKVKSFLFIAEKAQMELNHLQILSRISFLGWMISRYDFFAQILFITISSVNLIVLFTVSSISDNNYRAGNFDGTVLMYILGIVIIVISCIMYVLAVLFSYPVIIFNILHQKSDPKIFENESNKEIQGTIKLSNKIQSNYKEVGQEDTDYMRFIFNVLFDIENVVNIIMVILACLGWFNPLFYAVMMLDILRRSVTLKSVLLVITKNKKSLILTVILLIIVVYVFSVWGFNYLGDYYQETDGGNYSVNTYCHTLWQCFTSTLDGGIRAGGGAGDILYPTFMSEKNYALRQFFSIAFFVIVIIILLNIIFGIIVDTFAELRDTRREIEADIENICFVCGLPKHEFELRGSGWAVHNQIEHNMWSYLAYIIYIKKKPIIECDGIEKYVKNKLLQNDITFFPKTALCLVEGKEELIDAKEMMANQLNMIEMKLRRSIKK